MTFPGGDLASTGAVKQLGACRGRHLPR